MNRKMKAKDVDEFYYNGVRFYKSINGYYYQDFGKLGKLRIPKATYKHYKVAADGEKSC